MISDDPVKMKSIVIMGNIFQEELMKEINREVVNLIVENVKA